MARRPFNTAAMTPWIEVRFGPSAGPGGQNVNKVSTRATLLFDFAECPLLTKTERERIHARLATRLARDGRLRVVAQRERTQSRNRALAEQRLVELLTEALHVPKPRRPTRPTPGSRRRRLQSKRQRGQVKRLRQRPPALED